MGFGVITEEQQFNASQLPITELICDKAHPTHIVELSKRCSSASYEELWNTTQCFIDGHENPSTEHVAATIWLLIILPVGILGNILTLAAIPYALVKKRLEMKCFAM